MPEHESGTATALEEIKSLKRQVRQLQACLLAAVAICLAAATIAPPPGTLRASRLVLSDARGRDRIVLDAANGPAIHIRGDGGADRLFLGEEPDPVAGGKVYPRIAPAWGMLIYNPSGDERGGMSYLDNGRSIVSLDRANGEGVYMTVNEKSGFAGLIGNYEGKSVGDYAEAFRLGTSGSKVFAQASNRSGSAAGAVVGGSGGRLQVSDVAEK